MLPRSVLRARRRPRSASGSPSAPSRVEHPRGVVGEVRVRDRDALRQPGRAGRVHHVDEIVELVPAARGRRRGSAVELPRRGRGRRSRRRTSGRRVEQRLLRDEHRRPASSSWCASRAAGCSKLSGTIGAARLEDPEQRDDRAGRAIHAEPTSLAPAHAELAQAVGEPVRGGVELAVGERAPTRP